MILTGEKTLDWKTEYAISQKINYIDIYYAYELLMVML